MAFVMMTRSYHHRRSHRHDNTRCRDVDLTSGHHVENNVRTLNHSRNHPPSTNRVGCGMHFDGFVAEDGHDVDFVGSSGGAVAVVGPIWVGFEVDAMRDLYGLSCSAGDDMFHMDDQVAAEGCHTG